MYLAESALDLANLSSFHTMTAVNFFEKESWTILWKSGLLSVVTDIALSTSSEITEKPCASANALHSLS